MHKYKSYIAVGIVPQEHKSPLQIIIPIGTLESTLSVPYLYGEGLRERLSV